MGSVALRTVGAPELDGIIEGLSWAAAWPQELCELLEAHPEIRLPAAPSGRNISHQIIALFAANQGLAFGRSELDAIGAALGRTGGDSIQWANKIERVGIRLDRTSGKSPSYGFESLRFSGKYLQSAVDLTTDSGRAESESRLRALFLDLSTDPFERGHRDPRKSLADGNLVMQPQEINRSYRDRYIFDERGLPKVPNPVKFVEDPSAYYEDEDDLRLIYEALRERFEGSVEEP